MQTLVVLESIPESKGVSMACLGSDDHSGCSCFDGMRPGGSMWGVPREMGERLTPPKRPMTIDS